MKPLHFDLPAAATALSLSEASVQKLVRERKFPKPRLLSDRRVAWLAR
ncbi:AlpA family transcriptional regulator [Burkholderia seminalis]|nr:AlpA family phage regulatory protein [Burkholderia seminalis]MCA8426395.1 AlpA family transcriptional regulator [Burkholderia seminalis]